MADFIAGYISGAASIILGSPLDIIKARLQTSSTRATYTFPTTSSLIKGAAPPILTYGALNALLLSTYNRCLPYLSSSPTSLPAIWAAGALGGLTTFFISTPTELVKCRAQLSGVGVSSWAITRSLLSTHGIRGLYIGGGVTVVRDAVGYGFYFVAYEGVKRLFPEPEGGVAILSAGGVAGCATWASIYPLDVVKTRVQTQVFGEEAERLLGGRGRGRAWHGGWGARECARCAWAETGCRVFFDGLGVCMARAFLVSAVQWAIYEYIMRQIRDSSSIQHQPDNINIS